MSDKNPTVEPRMTIPALQAKKARGERIVALTAYDHPTARILDEAGVDLILVGDSLGMVVLGYDNTLPVTMEDMIHHTRPVVRAVRRALVIGDMPYFSFHRSLHDSLANAARFVKEAGAAGVKVEGATPFRLKLIEALVEAEIPVMGHVGLTPQSVNRLGGFKVQGGGRAEARRILQDAQNLEKAGVFSLVLESIPQELARLITERVSVPTIGIGAGPSCDGQILVFHDLVGFSQGYMPRFVKKYVDINPILGEAVRDYGRDVRSGKFPDDDHSYHLKKEELRTLVSPPARSGGGKRR
jgi:3-methyl-2-oxobutanoate hydroxymethyltransferase